MRKFFRIFLITFNIIVAVSLILSYLCCFINPKTVWWIGFFGLAYMYLLVANLCFALLWLFSLHKKRFVISLLSIVLGWPFIGWNIQLLTKEIPEEEMDRSFKVISFNVQGFAQMNTIQPNGNNLNLFHFFREKDADIICMQEFVTSIWGKDLSEKNIRQQLNSMPFYHAKLTGKPGYMSGVATFSKYPIVCNELIFSDSTTNACICSDLLIGTDTVRVYNIHLKSVGFHHDEKHLLNNMVKIDYGKSDVRVVKSIFRQLAVSSFDRERQVRIISSHIAQSPYPVIICGDFNDPPTSYSYQKIRGIRKDAFVEAGSGRSITYNIGNIASLRIDNILFSDIFKAYNYDSPRVHLSDHFPVTCRIVKK